MKDENNKVEILNDCTSSRESENAILHTLTSASPRLVSIKAVVIFSNAAWTCEISCAFTLDMSKARSRIDCGSLSMKALRALGFDDETTMLLFSERAVAEILTIECVFPVPVEEERE